MRRRIPHPAINRRSPVFGSAPAFIHSELPSPFPATSLPALGVVIGLGNPMMHDDGVGPAVLRRLSPELKSHQAVECIELPWAGLSLLEVIRDRRWAVLVDCLVSGQSPPGTLRVLSEDDVRGSIRLVSYHDLSYTTALNLGRALGWALPNEVMILGIEGREVYEFGEGLSAEVDAAADRAARMIEVFVRQRIGCEPTG